MIKKATIALLFCAALATFGACKKDKKNEPAPTATITYKVETQNAASYKVSYTDADGASQEHIITNEATWSTDHTVKLPFQASIKAEAVRSNTTQPLTCNVYIMRGNGIVATNAVSYTATNVKAEISETIK